AAPEDATHQYQFVMVSKETKPQNGFFKYQFNVASIIGSTAEAPKTWQYPQLGYDEEALIVTGNVFNATPAYTGSAIIFLAKHRLYEDLPFDFCFFQGAPFNVGTIAPSIVLDQGPYTTLATAIVGSSQLRVYKFLGTSRVCPQNLGSSDIA